MTEPPTLRRRRILVIDDEESLRHSLAKSLRRVGYDVETAATGREGVDRFADRASGGGYDAVVTDVRLPDLSGLDIAALLTEVDPDVPVLVMTGFGSVESAMEAMRRGARDFLQKPFGLDDLVKALEREVTTADRSREERRLRVEVERRFAPAEYERVADERRRMPAPGSDLGGGTAVDEGSDVPADASGAPVGLKDAQRRFEIRYVEDLLARTGGNVAAAARMAGISRPNFHKKLKTLGVDARRFKDASRRGRSAGL